MKQHNARKILDNLGVVCEPDSIYNIRGTDEWALDAVTQALSMMYTHHVHTDQIDEVITMPFVDTLVIWDGTDKTTNLELGRILRAKANATAILVRGSGINLGKTQHTKIVADTPKKPDDWKKTAQQIYSPSADVELDNRTLARVLSVSHKREVLHSLLIAAGLDKHIDPEAIARKEPMGVWNWWKKPADVRVETMDEIDVWALLGWLAADRMRAGDAAGTEAALKAGVEARLSNSDAVKIHLATHGLDRWYNHNST